VWPQERKIAEFRFPLFNTSATTQRYVHIVKEHMIQELKNRHPSLNLRTERVGNKLPTLCSVLALAVSTCRFKSDKRSAQKIIDTQQEIN
jgi:hypothetical protein